MLTNGVKEHECLEPLVAFVMPTETSEALVKVGDLEVRVSAISHPVTCWHHPTSGSL